MKRFLYRHIDAPFIVIGMHRSGTSFLTKVLEEAGIHMGLNKDHNNEAFKYLNFNNQALTAAGASWLEPKVPEKKHWKLLPKMQLYVEHFRFFGTRYIWVKLFKQKPWGWKDPRNTFTLNMWQSVFPKARVVHIYRNGIDVAESLYQRNQVEGEVHDERLDDKTFGFNLWEQYIAQAFSYDEQLKDRIIHVKYEDLLDLNKQEIHRLEKFTNKKLYTIIKERGFTRKEKVDIDKRLQETAENSTWMHKLGYIKTIANA